MYDGAHLSAWTGCFTSGSCDVAGRHEDGRVGHHGGAQQDVGIIENKAWKMLYNGRHYCKKNNTQYKGIKKRRINKMCYY